MYVSCLLKQGSYGVQFTLVASIRATRTITAAADFTPTDPQDSVLSFSTGTAARDSVSGLQNDHSMIPSSGPRKDAGFVQTNLTLLMGESFFRLQGVDMSDSAGLESMSITTHSQNRLKDKIQ